MNITRVLIMLCVMVSFCCCKKDTDTLSVINSNSLHEQQVALHFKVAAPAGKDSMLSQNALQQHDTEVQQLDELISLKERVIESPENKLWKDMKLQWKNFFVNYIEDSLSLEVNLHPIKGILTSEDYLKWARLNVDLLKFSEEVQFGDALEFLLYRKSGYQFPDSLLKSIIYTHVFDDIYVNIIGSSSMEYQHTTGGIVKIIQDTNYPTGNQMVLKIETNDVRLLNIFIRIPSWAVNPKVSYGNVKYVAYPGQYSEVSRRWSKGDEITVSLKN